MIGDYRIFSLVLYGFFIVVVIYIDLGVNFFLIYNRVRGMIFNYVFLVFRDRGLGSIS